MKAWSEILFPLSLNTGLVTGLLGIILVCSVGAEEQSSSGVEEAFLGREKSLVEKYSRQSSVVNLKQKNINNGNEKLIAQKVTRIKGVKVNQTAQGLKLILETVAGSARLIPLILPEGNDLVIDIQDATLVFSLRNGVTKTNPAPGITKITVIKAEPSSIQVRITGENQTPSAEIVPGRDNLVLSIAPKRVTTEQKPDQEIEIIATGQAAAEDDYFVPEASTATRTDTPIRDIPQSIKIVPQQVIEDQQAIALDEALSNVSGVTTGNTLSNANESFNIRGFENSSVLQDGFRQFGNSGQSFAEMANLEQVEVLKGPASILYGEIEPGGIINLVTKKPLDRPFHQAELQLGDDALVSPQIDFSDALTSDGRLRYRLNALYQHNNSFRNFDQDFERFFIAPVISWQIGDRTDLTFQLDYTNDDAPLDNGLPVSAESIVDVPFDRVIDNPDNISESELINVGYNLEHRFDDNWRLRNAFRYSNRDLLNTGLIPIDFDEDTGTVFSSLAKQDIEIQNYSLQTNVVGKFNTGSVKHNLLFGVDLNRTDDLDVSSIDFENPQLIDIFDPVFTEFDEADINNVPVIANTDIQSDRLGVFLQDQVDILDNLILLAGVRYDTVEQTTVNGATESEPESSEITQNNDDFNPRVGLVYQPITQLSLFGSYSQSFSPNSETTSSGEPLDPEESEGFELGVKGEILAGKAFATLAYFNITKQNVATPDPIDTSSSVATGEQKSQGVEFDLSGEILPGWNIITSYAYIDAEVSKDNTIPVGNRLYNTPEHSASLWTTYEIQQGNLKGLGFGGGFNFVGEREGDLDNSFTLDSYFLANAAVFYKRNNWRFALNFKNLFDVDYITASGNRRSSNNDIGEPFSVIGSVSVEF
jgi:iron complex outermembrane recepter protein